MTCKLSICIATFNRAVFLREAVESVLQQLPPDCEIIVADNASLDGTEQLITEYAQRHGCIRYVRHDVNGGLDYNYDSAVEAARGDYCWLLADDDVMRPGAVQVVLEALKQNPSLVLVNYEFRDFTLAKVLQPRSFKFLTDRSYAGDETDSLFMDLDDSLWFIGAVVIDRSLWVAREREQYYGLLFIHIAVIFQQRLPRKVLVLATPLITYRMGNSHFYSGQIGALMLQKWPRLGDLLQLSSAVRESVRSLEPWNSPLWLLVLRGWGVYSYREYRQWIYPKLTSNFRRVLPCVVSVLPGVVVNAFLFLCFLTRKDRGRELQWMRRSPFNLWRMLTESIGSSR